VLIAYSAGQRIGQLANHNGTANADFVRLGSRDQTKYVHCAKLSSFDWFDSGRVLGVINFSKIRWNLTQLRFS